MKSRKKKRAEIPDHPVTPGSPLYRLLELSAESIAKRLQDNRQQSAGRAARNNPPHKTH